MIIAEIRSAELDDVEEPTDEELQEIEEEISADDMLQTILEELYG